MQNLGDLFPDNLRVQLINDNFKVGAVLRRFEYLTIPPKIKRSIIVGFDSSKVILAYVFINTEINPNLFPTQVLRDLHLELDPRDRDYLSHTSHVDCSQIFEVDAESIKNMMMNDTELHLGELSVVDLSNVLEKIKNAKTISKNIKKKFGLL